MKNLSIIITFIGIMLLAGIIVFVLKNNPEGCPICQTQQTTPGPITNVTDFNSCVKETGIVMESYPRQCRYNESTYTENIGNELEKIEFIQLNNPRPNQIIESPLLISGQAKTWYFEGELPVKLLDGNNNILIEKWVTAQEDWMVDKFVPFEGQIEFETPETDTGTLIILKNNPSDFREFDDQLEIPVRFK